MICRNASHIESHNSRLFSRIKHYGGRNFYIDFFSMIYSIGLSDTRIPGAFPFSVDLPGHQSF
jgi:hypothetical protein